MTFPPHVRSFAGASIGALVLVSLIGCGGVVTRGGGDGEGGGGGGGDGGAAATTSVQTGGGGAGGGDECDPGACVGPAVAMTHAQLLAAIGEDPGEPPSDLEYLLYGGGTEAPSCGAPFGPGGCGGWSVHLTLPTSMLAPGTYPFSDPQVDMFMTESAAEGADNCSGGASGGLEDGQIQIYSVTATSVEFFVSGLPSYFSQDPNGYFVASRCP